MQKHMDIFFHNSITLHFSYAVYATVNCHAYEWLQVIVLGWYIWTWLLWISRRASPAQFNVCKTGNFFQFPWSWTSPHSGSHFINKNFENSFGKRNQHKISPRWVGGLKTCQVTLHGERKGVQKRSTRFMNASLMRFIKVLCNFTFQLL